MNNSHVKQSQDLLDRLAQPVAQWDKAELTALCEDLRQFLICHVADTGGHLASNLGVVEMTVALHKTMDTAVDRLIFDVGHQCYVHKILTGRGAQFKELRSFGALSGFPKPMESTHDAFVAGHASTAVSVALGMARARTLLGQDYKVAALVGDGALTGGLCYEGLSDAGQSGEPLVIILNDNGMSITQNVGGMARSLAKLRLQQPYFKFKKGYQRVVYRLPGGKRLDKAVQRVKTAVKAASLPASFFESMGFTYLGPADGHDLMNNIRLLQYAFSLKRPVLLHLMTQKGKGYAPSEKNPSAFHGVSRFDVSSGQALRPVRPSFGDRAGQILCALAETNPKICAITAAMATGTGLTDFAKLYPARFFDVGIAEEHAVTMAAGMAKQGLLPVCCIYSTFLQRSYDQIVHDVALSRLPVLFLIDRAGLVGEDGETHHGLLDTSFLGHIPHMELWSPANYAELSALIQRHFQHPQGPVAIRYPRGDEGAYRDCQTEPVLLRNGGQILLVTYGTMINDALTAADTLAQEGIYVSVLKLNCLRPLPVDEVAQYLPQSRQLLFVEEAIPDGSPGQRLMAAMATQGLSDVRFTHVTAGDIFVPQGSNRDLKRLLGLDADSIANRIRRLVGVHS